MSSRFVADRLPKNYRTVLDVVNEFGAGRHASAQDVYQLARERQPGIGFTTVHRGLARLSALGHILKLDIPGEGSARYEPATAAHAHFRCTACGGLDDVEFALPAATVDELATRYGIAIRGESVTLSGICRSCAAT